MPKITAIDFRILVRVFESDGFVISRRKGDHIVMTKPGVSRPVVIKSSPHQVPVMHIRTNLTTAGSVRSSDGAGAREPAAHFIHNSPASTSAS